MKDSVEPALLLLEAGANPRQSRYGEPGSGLVLTPEAVARLYPDVQDVFRHALTQVTGVAAPPGPLRNLHGLSKTELNGRCGV